MASLTSLEVYDLKKKAENATTHAWHVIEDDLRAGKSYRPAASAVQVARECVVAALAAMQNRHMDRAIETLKFDFASVENMLKSFKERAKRCHQGGDKLFPAMTRR